MPIGSQSQRDSRRRRVILEEVNESSTAQSTSKRRRSTASSDENESSESVHQRYTPEALVENHVPISWLLPKKWWVLASILVSFLLLGALVNYLHMLAAGWSEVYGSSNLVALDLSTDGGLAKWLTSMLLILGSFYCLQIFVLRRHRCDDYRGTYRIWPWVAAILLLASMDATANISGFLFAITSQTPYISNVHHSEMGWFAVCLSALILVSLRIAIEVKQSLGAMWWTFLSFTSLSVYLISKNEVYTLALPIENFLLHKNLVFFGVFSLISSLLTYGRFVYLDSQGLLLQRFASKEAQLKHRQEAREKRLAEKVQAKEERQQKADAKKQEAEERKRIKADEKAKIESEKAEAKRLAAEKNQAQKAAKKQAASEKQKASDAASSKTDSKSKATEPKRTAQESRSTQKSNGSKSTSKSTSSSPEHQQRTIQPLSVRRPTQQTDKQSSQSKPAGNSRPQIVSVQQEAEDYSVEELQEKLNGNLSKSERRRLRKLMKREQRRAA